jgi:HPt (histidine-containing phosphotransfer) domain-containing protein
MMLDQLEPSGLAEHISDMAKAIESKDYKTVMDKAHAIKGNVGWVGASRLHYAAYYV